MAAARRKTAKKAAKTTAKKPAKKTVKKPAKKTAKKPAKKPAKTNGTSVRVRMYRQGLGDCFLLTFNRANNPFHLLIDCGTLGATTTGNTMKAVAEDIVAATGGHLHLLVATHEHKDHVSGFNSQRALFDSLAVDQVWAAWTEDPEDDLAKSVAKYKGDLGAAVAMAANAFARGQSSSLSVSSAAKHSHETVAGLLDFVGEPGSDGVFSAEFAKTVHAAMEYVRTRAGTNVDYLDPGDLREPIPGVRVYVLGPPRDLAKLKNEGEHGSPDLYSVTAAYAASLSSAATFALSDASLADYHSALGPGERSAFEGRLPFDPRFNVDASDEQEITPRFPDYFDPANDWRRIDHDWLNGASDLALQLDSYTNNTSLALAIEIVETGQVLLFPADAQQGNWLSWHEPAWHVRDDEGTTNTIKATHLLARTVFYKAGHHASHNATGNPRGFELIEQDELVVFIPVDRQVAMAKTPPWVMPAATLYTRLVEKAKGRVVRSDTLWPEDEHRPASMSKAEWAQARKDPRIDASNPLFVDFVL